MCVGAYSTLPKQQKDRRRKVAEWAFPLISGFQGDATIFMRQRSVRWIALSLWLDLKFSLLRLNETDDWRDGIGQGRRSDFGGTFRRRNEHHIALRRCDMKREN